MLKRLLFIFSVLIANAVSAKPDGTYLYVLGVAQDAGYPQVGCYMPHCMPGWENPALRRGATSIALIDSVAQPKRFSRQRPIFPRNSILLS